MRIYGIANSVVGKESIPRRTLLQTLAGAALHAQPADRIVSVKAAPVPLLPTSRFGKAEFKSDHDPARLRWFGPFSQLAGSILVQIRTQRRSYGLWHGRRGYGCRSHHRQSSERSPDRREPVQYRTALESDVRLQFVLWEARAADHGDERNRPRALGHAWQARRTAGVAAPGRSGSRTRSGLFHRCGRIASNGTWIHRREVRSHGRCISRCADREVNRRPQSHWANADG